MMNSPMGEIVQDPMVPIFPSDGDEQLPTIPIAIRKKPGCYKGWFEKIRSRLHQERTAHADEIKRIKHTCQQQADRIIQQLQLDHKRELEYTKTDYEKKIKALNKTIVELKMQLKLYQDNVSGKGKRETLNKNALNKKKKSKSKPKKAKHPGRKPHSHLPVTLVEHDLSEDEKLCGSCGLPYEDEGMAEESEELDYTVVLRRKRHRRKTLKRACQCIQQPLFKTAPLPPKAMKRSQYSDRFWIEVIMYKYVYHLPLTRLSKMLQGHGANPIPSNTLTDGIVRFCKFLDPIEEAIIEHNLGAHQFWQADDTRIPVFVPVEGKASYNQALWQIQTSDCVVFFASETREAQHIQSYFEDISEKGTLLADRAKVYQTLCFFIVFCWSHVRRDFIRISKYSKGSLMWATAWVKLIADLFHLNKLRRNQTEGSELWQAADDKLRLKLADINLKMNEQLNDPKLRSQQRKALESLKRHWHGLTRFVEDPQIPMDNNAVERIFRMVANFRKSSNGVFSQRFAQITATMFTIIATLNLNNINIRHFFEVYLEDVALNGGNPPSCVNNYLPWSMSDDIKQRLNKKPISSPDTS